MVKGGSKSLATQIGTADINSRTRAFLTGFLLDHLTCIALWAVLHGDHSRLRSTWPLKFCIVRLSVSLAEPTMPASKSRFVHNNNPRLNTCSAYGAFLSQRFNESCTRRLT